MTFQYELQKITLVSHEGGDFITSCLTLKIIKMYDAVIGIMSKYATISTGLSQPPESTVFTIYLIIIKVTGTISEKYASM